MAAIGLASGSPASAADDSIALSGILRPGMIFRDLMLPLNRAGEPDVQIMSAEEAVIREPAHLLQITGLRFSSGQASARFDLQAPTAVYDLKAKTIHASEGFRGNGFGFHYEGAALRGSPKTLAFDLSGIVEIQSAGLFPTIPSDGKPARENLSDCRQVLPGLYELRPDEGMTSVRLVQDFAGDLATFVKCWDHVEDPDPCRIGGGPAGLSLIGLEGGWMDLRQCRMHLTGRSALLGPRTVLTSSGGIRLREESPDGDSLIRVTGKGQIKAWMHPSKSIETWIRAESFGYVSDRQILQFKGGPLVVSRDGAVLEATENWQFVRIFAGGRIVLSTGSWNMVKNPE